jgi:hypothetical protein
MSHITLSAEQARLVEESYPVQVRDPKGKVLGHIEPPSFTPEESLPLSERRRPTGRGIRASRFENNYKH